jgi:uncharacterized membrane protein YqjE
MSERGRPGYFASLRRLAAGAAELAEVRLELFATELQQEKLRVLESLLWLAVSVLAIGVGLVLLAVFVVTLVEERYRLAALGVVVLVCFGVAWAAWRVSRARMQGDGPPFEASIAELRRDRAALTGREPGAAP